MYLSQEDLKILKKAVNYNMNYIGRDEDGNIWMYEELPTKGNSYWLEPCETGIMKINNKKALNFISWDEDEPANVTNLLFRYIYIY